MTRQQKYPDTTVFHYHNENPKGRITGDCRIRGLATATGIDYNKIVLALAVIQIETGYDQCAPDGISILMDRLGWTKQKMPVKPNGKRYTLKEFCKIQQKHLQDKETVGMRTAEGIVISPRIFCNCLCRHELAIVDGKVWDIWDSTGKFVGNYWTKG